MATTLLCFLLNTHGTRSAGSERGFIVDEWGHTAMSKPLWGLFASTLAANIISTISFPILLSLSAYCIAAPWLDLQERKSTIETTLMTPLQYALLFRIFSSPGPISVAQAMSYIRRRKRRAAAPAYFSSGIALAGALLVLSYSISIANLWLHATARVVISKSADNPAFRGYYPPAPSLVFVVLLYLHALLSGFITIRVASLRSSHIVFQERKSPAGEATRVSVDTFEAKKDTEEEHKIDVFPVALPPTRTPRPPGLLLSAAPEITTATPTVAVVPLPLPAVTPHRERQHPPAAASLAQSSAAASSRSSTASSHSPQIPTALALAHKQLTSPFAPIAALLASRSRLAGSGARRSEGLIGALWVEDANTARVEVGIWRRSKLTVGGRERSASVRTATTSNSGTTVGTGRRSRWGDLEADVDDDGVFGVYKRIVPWRGEIY
ncbi:hypothetical protein HMN09_01087500 [Mycena chlorophos]|uniref:Uncharacterized protein n=1 Tax=Mycena chlorophos TaxID=658473 RepID=A0A8H6VW49_MYCCL|nr:hypothetical protein HMN09_01087500 [Mycena chlorophos]